MDIITLCITLVIFQPLIVYFAFYKDTGLTTQNNEFYQSFLVLSPSLAFFYLDQYWYALSLLVGVTLCGLLLAIIVNRKASHPIDRDGLIAFAVAWLIIFGVGHLIASFFTDSTVTTTEVAVTAELNFTTITQGIYSALTSSLYYLVIMLGVLLVRILEKKYSLKEKFSDLLLLLCSVIGGVLPMLGDYFILSIIFNFFILFTMSRIIMTLEGSDAAKGSNGAIGFMFSYLFMMGIGFTMMIKGGAWLYSIVS
ncbi:hypothetical protein [Shewanella livingstonensis]|uniref:Uncharacterized protein n=1 Tax=Shewanella livingstonensis TaxID=150120 RepID=A0A3G8LYM9_9GAMM|nr:hypothetical protein [Shewanella livingstonensis]AZG74863.1 hypothetical protein EGC82_20195 [Shewanella livingstonensis]